MTMFPTMRRSSTLSLLGLLTAGCLVLPACSAAEDEEVSAGEAEVISVQDLGALETELDLKKDVKAANGRYARGDDRFKAGGCYKSTVALGANGGDNYGYEGRRYVTGAAFFAQKGSGYMSGDARPVLCMDLDTKGADGKLRIAKIGRFEVDAMVRYHLGREGAPNADGSTLAFTRGAFVLGPKVAAGTVDSIDKPLFRSRPLKAIKAGPTTVDPSVASLVYRWAWNDAVAEDTFTLKNDPVGKLVSVSVDGTVRFEKIEVRKVKNGAKEQLLIVPAGAASGATPNVSCERPADGSGRYKCRGLGRGNADPEVSEAKLANACTTCTMVPGASMRNVALGMTPEQVRAILGQPDRTETWLDEGGQYFTSLIYGYTTISLVAGRVTDLLTYSDFVKTIDGIGLGSPRAAVLAAFPPGLTCTDMDGGEVCTSDIEARPFTSITFLDGALVTVHISSAPSEEL